MRIRITAIVLCILLLAAVLITHAQTSSELSTLGDRVVSHIQSQKPDWKYERVPPIAASADVIAQQWDHALSKLKIAAES